MADYGKGVVMCLHITRAGSFCHGQAIKKNHYHIYVYSSQGEGLGWGRPFGVATGIAKHGKTRLVGGFVRGAETQKQQMKTHKFVNKGAQQIWEGRGAVLAQHPRR